VAEAEPVVPWWTRALLEPVTLLAFAAAALLAGWPGQLVNVSSRATSALAARVTQASPGGSQEWVGLVATTVVASLLLAGLAIRGAQRFVAAPAGRGGARASR
jgi:hypothetical protein